MKIAVLTTGRQDWGILRPLCEALQKNDNFKLEIFAGGMACSEYYGNTVEKIRLLGFSVSMMEWNTEEKDIGYQISKAAVLTSKYLHKLSPDALLLLGDRFETAAAALAATVNKVPIIHLYGGEETEGAFDNALRHSITKMSHLHFVANEFYADRVLQMGEKDETVHVVGYLSVDNILRFALPDKTEMESRLGISLKKPVGLITVHPTTLSDAGGTEGELFSIKEAISRSSGTWIVTLPNNDPGNQVIRKGFETLSQERENVHIKTALGEENYLGLMKNSDFVLGNSSSGMIEAPALGVPTINVGDRQKGRIECSSVITVPCSVEAVLDAIRKVTEGGLAVDHESNRKILGDGNTASKIMKILNSWNPPVPPRKSFVLRDCS